MQGEIVITTGARLHFGFFAHRPHGVRPASKTRADASGSLLAETNYGGVGLMIDSPSFVVAASKSERDHVACPGEIPAADRTWAVIAVERLVAHYRSACPSDRQPPPCAIEVRRLMPPHSGLGSGTQLAMAVAQALALIAGDQQADGVTLGLRMGRGKRSAIGIHGFARGGFLVDGGKRSEDEIGQLVARIDVPQAWRWLLITPADSLSAGLSGQEEVQALERLPGMALSVTERLCRLALLDMLPALEKADCEWFGEALFQFGRAVGDYFRPVQGGQYVDARMAALVDWLCQEGIRGVAQTSWGPTIAICRGNAQIAELLKARILADSRWHGCRAEIAAPLNRGAAIQR